jgi:tRNA(Ile2) C34 agmatinyltransferase TiaS
MQNHLVFTLVLVEAAMSLITVTRYTATAEAVSNILNCICPECGGRMGGLGLEFKCQGRCRTDWRELWESVGERSSVS